MTDNTVLQLTIYLVTASASARTAPSQLAAENNVKRTSNMLAQVMVLTLVMVSLAGAVTASEGSVCVATLDPDKARRDDHDMPDGRPQRRGHSYKFSVQIDELAPVEVPVNAPVLISGLDARERHRVIVRDDDIRIESFFFSFADGTALELCLSYTPWYQTWQLDPPRPGTPWCRCEND